MDRKVKGKITPSTTMKDENFLLAVETNPEFVLLEDSDRLKLSRALKNDVDFLASQGLMDYSLLVGIETLGETGCVKD